MQSLDGTVSANAGFAHLRMDCVEVRDDRQAALAFSMYHFPSPIVLPLSYSTPRVPVGRICNVFCFLVLSLAFGLWL